MWIASGSLAIRSDREEHFADRALRIKLGSRHEFPVIRNLAVCIVLFPVRGIGKLLLLATSSNALSPGAYVYLGPEVTNG